jgi:hypothetical protein
VAALAVVATLADDYGQSWDDHGDARFGAASLRAYLGDPAFLHGYGDRLYYGPFFFMLSQVVVRLGQLANPGALAVDIRHLLNALMLILAGVALYWLSMRLTESRPAALVTVLLFALQPAIFGHAFINQKDTPFMALFVLAVATGILAVDKSHHAQISPEANDYPPLSKPSRARRSSIAVVLVVLIGAVAAIDLLRWGLLYQAITRLLGMAYAQTGPGWLNDLFRGVAQDAYKTPFPLYVQKMSLVYAWTSAVLGLVILAVLVMWATRWLPPARAKSLRRDLRLGLILASAGAVLGACTSTRPLGLFAGALVMLYSMLHPGRRTAVGLLVYFAAGAAAAYLVWPFLWAAPLTNLVAAVQLALNFVPHIVLFNGIHYPSTELPRTYLPWLLAIQLTETALLAFAGGVVIAIRRLWRRHSSMNLLIVVLAWFIIPLAYVVLLRPSIYGNFRQFLFILPPLLIVAGLAVGWLFSQLRHWALHVLAALLLLAPGLAAIAQLHPYEYIYYNSIVGGVRGAAGQFELDYWCTSYRDAMDYVNEHAGEGTLVAVNDPLSPARTFARPDLIVKVAPTADPPDFALVCDERHMMDRFYPEMDTVFVVTVDGVSLAEVKQRSPANGSEASAP